MATIVCCKGKHKCRSFVVKPQEGFEIAELLFLSECPVCGTAKAVLRRWTSDYKEVPKLEFNGEKAIKLYEKQEIWQNLEEELRDTTAKYVHGEFTKTKTRVVNHRGTVLEEWDTPAMKVYRIEDV